MEEAKRTSSRAEASFESKRGAVRGNSSLKELLRSSMIGGCRGRRGSIWGLLLLSSVLWNLGCGYEEHERRQQAAARAREACDGGDQTACNDLGEMYELGRGVTRSSVEAMNLYRKACDAGLLVACSNLGWIYQGTFDVPAELDKARSFFQRACDGGLVEGCYRLGAWYYKRAAGNDLATARTLWRRACEEGGHLGSCMGLAGLISFDAEREEVKNWPEALALLQRACDGGEAVGCDLLGMVYYEGEGGVQKDRQKARDLFRRACDAGEQKACDRLEKLD